MAAFRISICLEVLWGETDAAFGLGLAVRMGEAEGDDVDPGSAAAAVRLVKTCGSSGGTTGKPIAICLAGAARLSGLGEDDDSGSLLEPSTMDPCLLASCGGFTLDAEGLYVVAGT